MNVNFVQMYRVHATFHQYEDALQIYLCPVLCEYHLHALLLLHQEDYQVADRSAALAGPSCRPAKTIKYLTGQRANVQTMTTQLTCPTRDQINKSETDKDFYQSILTRDLSTFRVFIFAHLKGGYQDAI